MAELSKGPMPDQVTAMAMYQHAPNPNGVRPQRLVGVDRTPVARVAAKCSLPTYVLRRREGHFLSSAFEVFSKH